MALVALLSNPRSTGNKSLLPQIRSFCAERSEIFHYEVEEIGQIANALRTIALVRPKVLIINGGDGTVQTTLTELHYGHWFGDDTPPVAVLPNGKTNLIALDLGATGDPIAALERVLELARGDDLSDHIVERGMISLADGSEERPVLGMFLGGAGLADTMLYCRHRIYPLGLPNGVAHVLTVGAVILSMILGVRATFLPPRPRQVRVSLVRRGVIQGRFSLLIVTTLERLLVGTRTVGAKGLQLMMVDQSPRALLSAISASARGQLRHRTLNGVVVEEDDEIRIEGDRAAVILDGETFRAKKGGAIVLTHTQPVEFLRLAA